MQAKWERVFPNGKAPYPMLDLAHSVFNAVTGVPVSDEREELR